MLIDVIHTIDNTRVSSLDKEIVWDASASMEIMPKITKELKDTPLVMGRSTWESLGEKPIGNCKNYVISRRKVIVPRGVKVVKKITDIKEKRILIIGGATLINSFPISAINSIKLYEIKEDLNVQGTATRLASAVVDICDVVEDHDTYYIREYKSVDFR